MGTLKESFRLIIAGGISAVEELVSSFEIFSLYSQLSVGYTVFYQGHREEEDLPFSIGRKLNKMYLNSLT
jgi:hypothetical protein